EVARAIHREGGGRQEVADSWSGSHRPVPLGIALLDPAVFTVCDVEVSHGIYGEGTGNIDLAEGRAAGGKHGPVPLGIPLLDPVIAIVPLCDIEVARGVCRQGTGIPNLAGRHTNRGSHRPIFLGVSLLDPATVPDVEVARGILS